MTALVFSRRGNQLWDDVDTIAKICDLAKLDSNDPIMEKLQITKDLLEKINKLMSERGNLTETTVAEINAHVVTAKANMAEILESLKSVKAEPRVKTLIDSTIKNVEPRVETLGSDTNKVVQKMRKGY